MGCGSSQPPKNPPAQPLRYVSDDMKEWIERYPDNSMSMCPPEVDRWYRSKNWHTKWPLHYAAMKGDIPEIRYCVQELHISVNTEHVDWYHSHPLGWAASLGQMNACLELVLLGADPMLTNKASFRALTDARRENKTNVIAFFEEYERRLEEEDEQHRVLLK